MFGKKKKNKGSVKVRVEKLPSDREIDESKLVEVKDEMILARLNQAVPEIAVAVCAGAKAVSAAHSPTYKAILPSGTKLTPSREMKGAFRGIFRGSKNIGGQANFLPTSAALANATTLAFGVAALIVGQKYMSDISKSLHKLNEGLEYLSAFQNNEYKSKLNALIDRVTVIVSYRYELMHNHELRGRTLIELNNLEAECAELLGQANETVETFAQKKTADFKKYCETVQNIQVWVEYQNKLLAVLYHIGELKYALNLGAASKEYCTSLFGVYFEKTSKSRKALKKWQNEEIKKLKIDEAVLKRKREGVDAVVHFFPGLVNEEKKYRQLPDDLAETIRAQRSSELIAYRPLSDKTFEDDVEIIVKDGKVYYLENM